MMTTEVLMARHKAVVPVQHRDEYEGEMAGVIAVEVAKHGDTPEAARRISTIARCRAVDMFRAGKARKEVLMSSEKCRDMHPATCGEPGEDYEIAEVVAKIDENLTKDELKLARLMRDGATEVEAAEALSLPRTTVEDRWKNLQAKMRRLMVKYA